MKDQAIQLLTEQIAKLQLRNFELKSWKRQTAILLMRIFGENDPKVAQIEQLDFEFNSWSLRDASGNESYEQGRKQAGRDVLEAAIRELELLGLPQLSWVEEKQELAKQIAAALQDELKGSQVKQIRQILKAHESDEEKQRLLSEILETLHKDQLKKMFITLLMSETLNKTF